MQRRRWRERREAHIKTWGQSTAWRKNIQSSSFLSVTHFSDFVFSLFLSFLKSSSAPLWAGFKDSKCEESHSVWVNTADRKLPTRTQCSILFLVGWLHVFCVVISSQSSSSILIFNPSTDSVEQKWKKETKQKVDFEDSAYLCRRKRRTSCLRLVTELDLTCFCEESVSSSFFLLTYCPNIVQLFLI